MRFLRSCLGAFVALTIFVMPMASTLQGFVSPVFAATIVKPAQTIFLESLSFKKSNGKLAEIIDTGTYFEIQFAGTDMDGLSHLALNPQYTFKPGIEVIEVRIVSGDDPNLMVYHDYRFGLGGNWVADSVLRQRKDLYIRIAAYDQSGQLAYETYPIVFKRTDGVDPVTELDRDGDGGGVIGGPIFGDPKDGGDGGGGDGDGKEEPPLVPPVTPDDPFSGEPPTETAEPYDRPSEALPGSLNPLFGKLARIPALYRFAFPRYVVNISNPQEFPTLARLMIGQSVDTEVLPKYFLGDNDDADKGIIKPAVVAALSDAFCPTGKHPLVSRGTNDFTFDLNFQEAVPGLFLFMLDEDGDGDYNVNNAFGNNELLNVAFVGPGPGVIRHNFTTRALADLSYAGNTGLYGRAVLVAYEDGRLPPLDPQKGGTELMAQLEQYLPVAVKGDDFAGDKGKTWAPFGDLMEGEGETYCFHYAGELEEFPSEPLVDYPRQGKRNGYFPEYLSYDEDEKFFLGDPAGRINTVLVQQGKLDPKYLTFEREPELGNRVEPSRVQKQGDDRNGVVRRGFVRETLRRGEILFEVNRANVLEVTATLLEGGGTNADGERVLYFNALLDKQADGEYQGKPFSAERGALNDWIIQNYEIVFPLGQKTVTFEVPFHLENVTLPSRGTYLRLMVNETPARVDTSIIWNGNETVFGDSAMYGEAETYYVDFLARRTKFDAVAQPSSSRLASLQLVQANVGTSDYDGDGVPDDQDTDTDGDGLSDVDEGRATGRDTDGYGVPDYLDPDADGDGLPDAIEGPGKAFQKADYGVSENISDLDGAVVSNDAIATFVGGTSGTGVSDANTALRSAVITQEVDRVKTALLDGKQRRFNPAVRPPQTREEVEALSLVEGAGGDACLREGVAYTLNDIAGGTFESYIRKAAFLGLVQGYQNQFNADGPLQRDQLAKVVAITLCLPIVAVDTPTYSDVQPDAWSYEWVEAVTKAGIFQGFEGKYRPGDMVNRAEFYTVLGRIAEVTGTDLGELRQKTVEQVADLEEDFWYADGVAYGFLSEGLDADTTEFDGAEPMTRGDAVRLLIGHLMPFIGVLQ